MAAARRVYFGNVKIVAQIISEISIDMLLNSLVSKPVSSSLVAGKLGAVAMDAVRRLREY